MKILSFMTLFFIMIILNLMIVSCRKDESAVPNLTAQQVKLNNLEYMTLKVTNTDQAPSYHLHKSGQGNQSATCQISKTDLAIGGQEILCWLEAEELDLYFNGLDLAIEVPSGVCDYVSYAPYYFYQYPWGRTDYGRYTGQPWMNYTVDESCISCVINNFTLNPPFDNNQCYDQASYSGTDFDYTETGGPNCDEGLTLQAEIGFSEDQLCQNSDDLITILQTITEVDLGGLRGNCISGVGSESEHKRHAQTNLPYTEYYKAIDGLENTYEYEAPIALGLYTNIYLANYIKDCADSEYSYDPGKVLEYSSQNTLDISGDITSQIDPLKGSQLFYTWTCYNKAKEVSGIIRLQVRDWNTHFTLDDGVDKTNPTKMDLTGNEDLIFPESYNDFGDWDDRDGGANCRTDPTSTGFSFPGEAL